MEISQEDRDALDSKYDGVVVVATAFGDFAFRAVNEGEYKKFNKALDDGEKVDGHKAVCVTAMVWPTLVDGTAPDKDALRVALAKRPGLIHTISNHVMEHSGVSAAAARKK